MVIRVVFWKAARDVAFVFYIHGSHVHVYAAMLSKVHLRSWSSFFRLHYRFWVREVIMGQSFGYGKTTKNVRWKMASYCVLGLQRRWWVCGTISVYVYWRVAREGVGLHFEWKCVLRLMDMKRRGPQLQNPISIFLNMSTCSEAGFSENRWRNRILPKGVLRRLEGGYACRARICKIPSENNPYLMEEKQQFATICVDLFSRSLESAQKSLDGLPSWNPKHCWSRSLSVILNS